MFSQRLVQPVSLSAVEASHPDVVAKGIYTQEVEVDGSRSVGRQIGGTSAGSGFRSCLASVGKKGLTPGDLTDWWKVQVGDEKGSLASRSALPGVRATSQRGT